MNKRFESGAKPENNLSAHLFEDDFKDFSLDTVWANSPEEGEPESLGPGFSSSE